MGVFTEIGRTNINDKKNMIISKMNDGNYAIAQQLIADDGQGGTMTVFLKNPIILDRESMVRVNNLISEILDSKK